MSSKTLIKTTRLPSIIVFSYGNLAHLHKTLIGFSRLNPSSICVITEEDNLNQRLDVYKNTNSEFLTKNKVNFTSNSTYNKSLEDIIDLKDATHLFFVREGDCIDISSAEKLMSVAQNKTITYPEFCVTYSKPHTINRLHINIPSPKDETTRIETLISADFARSFVTPVDDALMKCKLPSKGAIFTTVPGSILISLLDTNIISLRRASQTVIFSSASSYSDPISALSPVGPFNSLAILRRKNLADIITLPSHTTLKQKIKHILKDNPQFYLLGQKTLHYFSIVSSKLPTINKKQINDLDKISDKWLIEAAKEVHAYNTLVFLSSKPHLLFKKESDKSLSIKTRLLQLSAQALNHDKYDYVLIVPWLISGGADKFFINYANAIADLYPSKNVLVISTEPSRKSLDKDNLGLSSKVDFLRIAEHVDKDQDGRSIISHILPIIISLVDTRVIHVGLSDAGYRFVKKYHKINKASGRNIILTGYNEIITDKKREGYVHDIIPEIFDIADIITTDNQKIIDLWSSEYGLAVNKCLVHHQPFESPVIKSSHLKTFSKDRPARVLWAAHIRKEKNPITYRQIAKRFSNNPLISFTAFGEHDKAHYPLNPFTHPRQKYLSYRGGYKNFLRDIHPENFDVFVYTSLADGTPNILIEAGMAELPIISSSIGGIASLIKEDGTLIIEPSDVDAYVSKLESFIINPRPFYKKADTFKNRLKKTQTIDSFKKEVSTMLKKIGY